MDITGFGETALYKDENGNSYVTITHVGLISSFKIPYLTLPIPDPSTFNSIHITTSNHEPNIVLVLIADKKGNIKVDSYKIGNMYISNKVECNVCKTNDGLLLERVLNDNIAAKVEDIFTEEVNTKEGDRIRMGVIAEFGDGSKDMANISGFINEEINVYRAHYEQIKNYRKFVIGKKRNGSLVYLYLIEPSTVHDMIPIEFYQVDEVPNVSLTAEVINDIDHTLFSDDIDIYDVKREVAPTIPPANNLMLLSNKGIYTIIYQQDALDNEPTFTYSVYEFEKSFSRDETKNAILYCPEVDNIDKAEVYFLLNNGRLMYSNKAMWEKGIWDKVDIGEKVVDARRVMTEVSYGEPYIYALDEGGNLYEVRERGKVIKVAEGVKRMLTFFAMPPMTPEDCLNVLNGLTESKVESKILRTKYKNAEKVWVEGILYEDVNGKVRLSLNSKINDYISDFPSNITFVSMPAIHMPELYNILREPSRTISC